MATKKKQVEISIQEITTSKVDFCVLYKTPIVLHRMTEKARQELLFPKGRKTSAEKAQSLKHDPYAEFRAAPYRLQDDDAPTLLAHLATAFKRAIAGAALDIPGATKAQIDRLLWVEGERVPLYGIPKILASVVRMPDQNHTPDIRIRAIIPEWAAFVTVVHATPMLKQTVIANLFGAAGLIQGVGDWRPGKGSGTYGQFELVSDDNEDFKRVVATGSRQAQIEAMDRAEPYDEETEELLTWFVSEADKRGFTEIAGGKIA